MTLDPARPEKTRRGVWGGVAPPVGLGFGMRPPPGSGSARNSRSARACIGLISSYSTYKLTYKSKLVAPNVAG